MQRDHQINGSQSEASPQHRDCPPRYQLENVLISKRPKDKSIVPEIKIADFGLAIALGPG